MSDKVCNGVEKAAALNEGYHIDKAPFYNQILSHLFKQKGMRLFSLILSILVFCIALYFLAVKIPYIDSLNDIIYISLLITLKAICVIGIIINSDFLRKKGNGKVVLFVSNDFSKRKKKKSKAS